MRFKIKFEGDLADQHRIPAYEGTKSLDGLNRSILMVSSYLVIGKVRQREFDRLPIEFNLVAQQPGSFESLYELGYPIAAFGGAVGLGVAGNLLTDLLKSVYRRATGRADPETKSVELAQLEDERAGDLEALVEAVEPSIRLGHNVINHGVININIRPDQAEPVVNLNPETKEYVWSKVVNNDMRAKLFSVGSFNANQGTGRAFDLELGRSISFELADTVDRATIETLLTSISSYTRSRRLGDELRSAVAIQYTSVDSVDGRVKKMRVHKARSELIAL